MMPDLNSRSVPWKWLAGILAVIVIALTAAWAQEMNRRVSQLEHQYVTIIRALERIEGKLEERKR